MEFIDEKTIFGIASFSEWISAMEDAMRATITGSHIIPKRMHIDKNRSTFLLMPCISDEYWSTKLVSFCPDNFDSGLPSIYGTILLNSTETGKQLAVIEGSAITAMRTAAVTAAGIKILASSGSSSLGIVGTGVQGLFQTLFACSVRDIKIVSAYDNRTENLERFEDEFMKMHPEIKVIKMADADQVAMNSEIVITATNSQKPVFSDKRELFEGKTFVGIGSYKPDCMEYPEQFFGLLGEIFVDTTDGKTESGDLITPVKEGWIDEDKIQPLGLLLSGKTIAGNNPTRFFKTVGSAVFDLYAAKLVYEKKLKISPEV